MDTSKVGKLQKRRRKDQTPPEPESNQLDMKTNKPVNVDIQNENPLLNPDILEVVLIFCGSHHQKDKTFLPTLRLVCKLWDIEVCKILRPQTQIPLHRLLSPYPEGLGWTWNRRHVKSIGYRYQSPYPETPEFPNVKVIVTTCNVIKDPKAIRWFKVMGSQVKSLHFSSALNCYYQNDFLWNCLQTWCPNLEDLNLSGIQCFASLIYIFEGEYFTFQQFRKEGLKCRKLKSLTISVDSNDPTGEFEQCKAKKSCVPLAGRRHDIYATRKCLEDFTRLIENLPERNLETDEAFYQLIENKNEELSENYFSDTIIPKYFGKYFMNRTIDWGIIGLILRAAPLQKITVKKLDGKQQCRDFTLFLLYQPSKLRSTLERLEFHDSVFVGRDPVCLKNVSLLKCPLKFVRLDNFILSKDSMGHFSDLLKGCAESLNALEVCAAADYNVWPGMVPPSFELPVLPNLRKLVNRNLSMLPMEGRRLLGNCPKLEICEFLNDGNSLDKFKRRALDLFCNKLEECDDSGQNLKELKTCGGLMTSENILHMGNWLWNLRKVDLEVGGADELKCLLGIRWGKMEEIRVVVGGMDDKRGESWNDVFTDHTGNIKCLKFLELDFGRNKPKLDVEAFRNGFAKLDGLTSLKLCNFGGFSDDKEEIDRSIKHIPCVSLSVESFPMKSD